VTLAGSLLSHGPEQAWILNLIHNLQYLKELYALYSSSNIIWVIKSRRMRWAGHVAHMGRG
jgi:hypothetical protein